MKKHATVILIVLVLLLAGSIWNFFRITQEIGALSQMHSGSAKGQAQTEGVSVSEEAGRREAFEEHIAKPLAPLECSTAADGGENSPCLPFEEKEGAAHRYAGVALSEYERELIARVIYHEARGESREGQRAVCEVILNRLLSDKFPDCIKDVIYQRGQFSSAGSLAQTTPGQEQYAVIEETLSCSPLLPPEALFFSTSAYNDAVCAVIGGHVFCRG